MGICIDKMGIVGRIGSYHSRIEDTLPRFGVSGKPSVKLPAFIKAVAVRVLRSARTVRSAVRQTFAARVAAKASDGGGGGSSDPDGRQPHAETNIRKTRLIISAFTFGGEK